MHHIRPHNLFHFVDTEKMEDRLISVVLPTKDSPMVFGTTVLLAIAKIANPSRYFEFGTYLGIQTLTIAANFPEAIIYTLDMNKNDLQKAEHQIAKSDKQLILRSIAHRGKKAFSGTLYEKGIIQQYGDSNKYDLSDLYGSMNMVYIDGGHDLQTLKSDTENAFHMISDEKCNCIVWHDYNNPNHPQINKYLENLSTCEKHDLFHVEESTFCFTFPNAPSSFKTKLLG